MNTTNSISLSQIGQIALTVKDLDNAIAFYSNKMGMRFLFQVPEMAFYDCGGVRLLLGTPSVSLSDRGSSVIYFRVTEINSAYEALLDRDLKFVREPHLVVRMEDHELWMAFFQNVDENLLAIMSEAPLKEGE